MSRRSVAGVAAMPLADDPPAVTFARIDVLAVAAGRGEGRVSTAGDGCRVPAALPRGWP